MSVSVAPRSRIPRPEAHAPSKPLSLPTSNGTGFRVSYAARGCVIGHDRNMTISAWNAPPTLEHVEAFISLAQELSRTYPQNSNVSLVMRDADLPGADARLALERLTAEYAHVIHSVALVIDGAGFRASMIRSFLTGLHLLRGNGYRCKTFTKPSEINTWLLPPHNADTGVVLTERDLQEACDAVLGRMAVEGERR